jgi:cellulose synthase/poly-beta-1,6-N-acetylglucosamine synthase-like glycosyltransferase
MTERLHAPTSDRVPQWSVDPPVVSVVLPCLDEADGVGRCVEKATSALHEMGIAGEVIVVDNGSTDGSAEIAARAGARVIHERRRGYGAAYLRGFREAGSGEPHARARRPARGWRARAPLRHMPSAVE